MGKDIATFLKLPEVKLYANSLVIAGGALERHGGWRSTTMAECNLDSSENNKTESLNQLEHQQLIGHKHQNKQ